MNRLSKEILFKDKHHEKSYQTFIEEMYLSEEEIKHPLPLLKRQKGFVYLLALYQEVYKQYEGEAFYIEAGEELSLGGPTYLLEESIGNSNHPHERILLLASCLLKGEEIDYTMCPIEDKVYFEQALLIVSIDS